MREGCVKCEVWAVGAVDERALSPCASKPSAVSHKFIMVPLINL